MHGQPSPIQAGYDVAGNDPISEINIDKVSLQALNRQASSGLPSGSICCPLWCRTRPLHFHELSQNTFFSWSAGAVYVSAPSVPSSAARLVMKKALACAVSILPACRNDSQLTSACCPITKQASSKIANDHNLVHLKPSTTLLYGIGQRLGAGSLPRTAAGHPEGTPLTSVYTVAPFARGQPPSIPRLLMFWAEASPVFSTALSYPAFSALSLTVVALPFDGRGVPGRPSLRLTAQKPHLQQWYSGLRHLQHLPPLSLSQEDC